MAMRTARYDRVRAAVDATAIRPVWGVLALSVGLFGLGVELPTALAYGPLLASAVLFGLPHGAIDHLAVTRVSGRAATVRSVGSVVGVYAIAGGLYVLLWFLQPLAAFVLFIGITWLHWGQGDVHALLALEGVEHLQSRVQRLGTLVVRGGLPMLGPLIFWGGEYRQVAALLVGRFGGSTAAIDVLFGATPRLLVGVGLGVVTVGTLGVGVARAPRGVRDHGWRRDAGETGLLWLFFWVVPPVVAVGLYFCLWHSLRHIARLIALDEAGAAALAAEAIGPALGSFARDAAPLTAVSLGLLGGLYLVVPVQPASGAETVGLYLVLISVLTLPHILVVSYMDRVEGIWRRLQPMGQ